MIAASLPMPPAFALRDEALRDDPNSLRQVEVALGVPLAASHVPPIPPTPISPNLPPHWNPAWPVPTAEELAKTEQYLQDLLRLTREGTAPIKIGDDFSW